MKWRAVLCAFVLTAAGATLSAGEVVRMTGIDTMKNFGKRLTEWYAMKNPSVQFEIAGTRPADSFAAMARGNVDIVQSSRRVLHSEAEALRSTQGKRYVELQVATEVAGIAVNTANPLKELSLFDLRQLLSGSVKNWKQVGGKDAPITIYGRDDSSGVRAFLTEEFMGDESISSAAKTFPTNGEMLAALSEDPNGVGFGTAEPGREASVRFLGIKASAAGEAISPTNESILAKRYKLIRPLYFYFAGPPRGDLLKFAEWVLSPQGQLVVESVGYYPLGPAEREQGMQTLTGP